MLNFNEKIGLNFCVQRDHHSWVEQKDGVSITPVLFRSGTLSLLNSLHAVQAKFHEVQSLGVHYKQL